MHGTISVHISSPTVSSRGQLGPLMIGSVVQLSEVARLGSFCAFARVFVAKGTTMLNWAVTFLIIALIAGALGLWGLQGLAMQVAWILFVVFLVLFVVSLVTGRRTPVP